MRLADPFGMNDRERPQHQADAVRRTARHRRRACRAANPAHSQTGQIGSGACPSERPSVTPSRRRPGPVAIMPIARSARMTVVASVFDRATFAVSAMRTTSPPMLLGQKVVEEQRDRHRGEQRAEGHPDVLRLEQQRPAPHARHDGERRRTRARRRATRATHAARLPRAWRRRHARTAGRAARCSRRASPPSHDQLAAAREGCVGSDTSEGIQCEGARQLYYGFMRKSPPRAEPELCRVRRTRSCARL